MAKLRSNLFQSSEHTNAHLLLPFVSLVVCVCLILHVAQRDSGRGECCDKLMAVGVLHIYVWQVSWARERHRSNRGGVTLIAGFLKSCLSDSNGSDLLCSLDV